METLLSLVPRIEALALPNQSERATHIASGLWHGAAVGASAKVYVYSRGGGFMVDARARGRRGAQYTNSAGVTKPLLMWATEGTAVRGRTNWDGKDSGHKRRRGAYRGRMPRYDIIDRAEAMSVNRPARRNRGRNVEKGEENGIVVQMPHHQGEEPLSQSLRRPGAIQTRGGMITKRAKKLAVNNFSSRLKPA